MDFMSDQLFDGRPIRILTVVDWTTNSRAGPLQGGPITSFLTQPAALLRGNLLG
jgi:hypothetical protein